MNPDPQWIVRYRAEAVGKIASKIEPPFSGYRVVLA